MAKGKTHAMITSALIVPTAAATLAASRDLTLAALAAAGCAFEAPRVSPTNSAIGAIQRTMKRIMFG